MIAVFWIMLASSALLTWHGLSQSSPRSLFVAAGLAGVVALPAAFSIGPYILLVAVLQLTGALALRRTRQP